jgi:hypothetical protein
MDEDYLGLIRAGRYKEAADYAQFLYRDIFGIDPSIEDKNPNVPKAERAGFFDAPITEDSIKDQAELDKIRSMFGTKGVGEAAQGALRVAATPVFGGQAQAVSELLPKAAANLFASFGLGDREEARPDADALTKHGQTGAEIGMQLLPFMGATKALQGAKPFAALGAKLFGQGTVGAAAATTAATLGTAGGLTELGRQVSVDVMNRLGHTTQEASYGEVPLAAVSFAAGGVPVNRVLAAMLQGGVSAAGQGVFLGEVDPNRVIMETIFAGVFGNPQFKELRNEQIKMTPEIADKIELAHNTENPRSRATQLMKSDDVARGLYVEQLAKQPRKNLESMKKLAEQAGDENAKAVIRDSLAQKDGNIVIGPEADAPATPVKPTPKNRTKKLNRRETLVQHLYRAPEGLSVPELMAATNYSEASVQRAIRGLDNPHGDGPGTGKLARGGGDDTGRMRYMLTEEAAGKVKSIDLEAPVHEEILKQMEEAEYKATDPSTPAPEKQAAQAELIRLSETLDNLRATGLDPEKLTKSQARTLVTRSLEGRTKSEIDSWLKDSSNLPDELKNFRDVVADVAGKLFRQFPEDGTLQATRKALVDEGAVVPDAPAQRMETVPKDIESIRRIGSQYGVSIKEDISGGYAVYRNGRKRLGKSGGAPTVDVHRFVKALAQGKIVDDPRMRFDTTILAARMKGWKAVYSNKKWTLSQPESGARHQFEKFEGAKKFIEALPEDYDLTAQRVDAEGPTPQEAEPVVTLKDLAEQQEPQAVEPTKPDVTNLKGTKVVGTNVTIADSPGVANLVPPGFEGPTYKKGQKVEGTPTWLGRYFTPIQDLMQTYSDLLGIPLYKEIWEGTNFAKNLRDVEFSRPNEERLADIHKGVEPYRYHAVQHLLMAEDIKTTAIEMNASQAEMKAALKLRDWYKDVLKLDREELHNFVHVGIPKIRSVDGELHMLEDYTLPGALSEILEDAEKGFLRLHDDNSMAVARDVLHAVGRKRYMSKPIAQAREMQSRLLNLAQKDPKNAQAFTHARELVQTYMDAVNNFIPDDAKTIAKWGQGMSSILRKFKLIEGEMLDAKDVERLAMMGTSWYGGLAMSARAALVVRNLTQPFLLGPKLGYGSVAAGFRQAIRIGSEGRRALESRGIISQPAMFSFAATRGARAGRGFLKPTGPGLASMLSKIESGARALQSYGLVAYRRADQFNRAVSYFAGQDAIQKNWKLYKKGDIDLDNFYIRSGLAGDSQAVQRRIMEYLSKGAVAQAADLYGAHTARSSQFLYSRADVPMAFQGVTFRAFGQFGVWPMAYWSYLRRNAGDISHVLSGPALTVEGWGRKAIGAEPRARGVQQRYRDQFTTRMIAQVAAFAALGSALGIDVSSWNKANPFAYSGGPSWQSMRDLYTVATGAGSQFERNRAKRALLRTVTQLTNPFAAAYHDIEEALEADNWEEFWKLALGFTPTED